MNWRLCWGLPLIVLLGVVVLLAREPERSSSTSNAAQVAATSVPVYLENEPRSAALAALASQRLRPSMEAEMAMLSVAGSQWGVERVVRAGSPRVEAAVRMRNLLLTAGSDRRLRVWRAGDGALLGEARTPRPLGFLAESNLSMLVAGADRQGRVTLIDVSNLRHPALRQLDSRVQSGGGLLALGLSATASELLGFDRSGTLSRVALATDTVTRTPLSEIAAPLPTSGPWIAAQFETEFEEALLVASGDGGAARIDLDTSTVSVSAEPGFLPGQVTSLSSEIYPMTLAVGGTGGGLEADPEGEPLPRPGPPITGLAYNEEGQAWVAGSDGVTFETEIGQSTTRPAPGAGPVEGLVESSGGALAIHPGGAVSLLAEESGISLPDGEPTPVASFGPAGELLVAEGFDANHVEMLKTVQPGRAVIDGELVDNPDLRHYRPDPDWWPYAEDEDALYVNDALIDDDFVLAAGQDPAGEAVVLVWDAETGEPLQRLALGTGGVDSAEPSIVSSVIAIPGKHLIAAYSAVQELVAFWSTETWEQVDVVPVGPAGDLALSPDEATLLVAGTEQEEGVYGSEEPDSSLIFVDVDSAKVIDEVKTGTTDRVAWAPDGDRFATIGYDASLRIWSPGGEPEVRRSVPLDALPVALAWRPDGEAIAVALDDGTIVLVPVDGGLEPVRLPGQPNTGSFRLSWSADGSLLAATTSAYDEDGEGYEAGSLQIYGLTRARLERRMCQLAGGPASAADWRRLMGEDVAPLPLCRVRDRLGSEPAPPEQGPAVLAFQSHERLFTADAAGRTRLIGQLPDEWSRPSFAWDGGNLGWVADGKASILRAGAESPEWWPCPCSGVAWRDGALLSVAAGSGSLLEFRSRRKHPRVSRPERPLDSSRLLGVIGEWAILGRNEASPSSMELDMVNPGGEVRHLLNTARGNVEEASSSPDGDRIVYSARWVTPICGAWPSIGVLEADPRGGVEVSFPRLPEAKEIRRVASVQVLPGGVGAAIGPLGCPEGPAGMPLDPSPPATRYELRGERWVPMAERGKDVQVAGGLVARLSAGGKLTLQGEGDDEIPVAVDVEAMVARP